MNTLVRKLMSNRVTCWLFLPVIIAAISPGYSPRRIKRHCKRRGIAHAPILRRSLRGGYKGHCVCGAKTNRYPSRALAIMMIDLHVDDEYERAFV